MDFEYRTGDYVVLLLSERETLVLVKSVVKTSSHYPDGGSSIYLFRGIEYGYIDFFFSELLEFNFYNNAILRRATEADMAIAKIKGGAKNVAI